MNAVIFQVLTILVSAGPAAPVTAPENALLKELVEKGVAMPDGQIVTLPPLTMAEGLSADEQAKVLEAVSPPRVKVEDFLDRASNAPLNLKLKKLSAKVGNDVIRTVNLHFVVYGDWNVLTSDKFSKTILKEGKAKNGDNGGLVARAGYIKDLDLTMRKLQARQTPNLKECFLYTTFNLFDEAEVSATRFCVATKTPAGVIVAAKVDPRLDKDQLYPNQWRQITKNALGNPVFGPPQPYSGAAFYAKVTRLIKPQNAIFVEFHQVFYEPHAWFGVNENRMPSELRKIIPFEVKQFRIKLDNATAELASKVSSEQKPEK